MTLKWIEREREHPFSTWSTNSITKDGERHDSTARNSDMKVMQLPFSEVNRQMGNLYTKEYECL